MKIRDVQEPEKPPVRKSARLASLLISRLAKSPRDNKRVENRAESDGARCKRIAHGPHQIIDLTCSTRPSEHAGEDDESMPMVVTDSESEDTSDTECGHSDDNDSGHSTPISLPVSLMPKETPIATNAAAEISEYEKLRREKILKNMAVINSLGIQKLPVATQRRPATRISGDPRKFVRKVEIAKPLRRSVRVSARNRRASGEESESSDEDFSDDEFCYKKKRRTSFGSRLKGESIAHSPCMQSFKTLPYALWEGPSIYGEIPGVPIGAIFPFRVDCSRAGIHKPFVAGISGHPTEGCYSIAVSGGYPEDVDDGDRIVFTGSGGRDLKGTKDNPKNLRTAPQTRDMELSRFNMALLASIATERPIRVVRGSKAKFRFAPTEGYRYDGLYRCVSHTYDVGTSGFKVYRFELQRLPGQKSLDTLPLTRDDPRHRELIENLDSVAGRHKKSRINSDDD